MADQAWEKVEAGESVDFDTTPEVEGTLAEVKPDVGKFKSTVYTLVTADGDKTVWGNRVLNDKMKKVALGSEVKIVGKGLKKTLDGSAEYRDYDVFFRPAPMVKVEDAAAL